MCLLLCRRGMAMRRSVLLSLWVLRTGGLQVRRWIDVARRLLRIGGDLDATMQMESCVRRPTIYNTLGLLF